MVSTDACADTRAMSLLAPWLANWHGHKDHSQAKEKHKQARKLSSRATPLE